MHLKEMCVAQVATCTQPSVSGKLLLALDSTAFPGYEHRGPMPTYFRFITLLEVRLHNYFNHSVGTSQETPRCNHSHSAL
jgi:hypothetical protein